MNGEKSDLRKISVQISRAQNLYLNSERKKKQNKWRVLINGGKKKHNSEFVTCAEGHPYWNCDIEIKLTRGQSDPIILVVVDMSNTNYGQVTIGLNKIPCKSLSNLSDLEFVCSNLEPNKKCPHPSGQLIYRVRSLETYSEEMDASNFPNKKRSSIFGFRNDHKQQRKQSYIESGSQIDLNYYDSKKLPKRLSFFKSSDKPNLQEGRSKAKSMGNIHVIEDIEDSISSAESDSPKQYMPSDDVYDQVTRNHGWVRVSDLVNEGDKLNLEDACSLDELEPEKVQLFSVQPDNGPITGHFTVVMEGSNFTAGLFDLTYICIDGLEPIDATTCTTILSDTEMLIDMPPVSIPGMVNICLELLDGSRINCAKAFHYFDSEIGDNLCTPLTPTAFTEHDADIDRLFEQYCEDEEAHTSTNGRYNPFEPEIVEQPPNQGIAEINLYDRRKLSDYGSQGSFRSDRTSSIRKRIRNIIKDEDKDELHEEVNDLRKVVSDLQTQLCELELSTSVQIEGLQCQLQTKDDEIDELCLILCNLKIQLLEDGLTKYLELL